MKLAIIGSRNLTKVNLARYIPGSVTEIVSGGARGIDTLAREYAKEKELIITEFLPQYNLYGKAAPIKRNREIAEYAEESLAFWDGKSRGTKSTISFFEKLGKKVWVIIISE